ncbi:MAG: nitrate/nitrite transporter NrtS [Leptolyngbyaceae bacterium]|nr:nitrate/nitrite transporter NrtS [Leptolyngbyaceae bacterium]
MLATESNPLATRPCDELYELTLRFGGEREWLSSDCHAQSPDSRPAQPAPSDPARLTFDTYRKNLLNPHFMPTAIRMAVVIGSLVFTVNHGDALLKNEMTRSRWLSGTLSFIVPYMVSIYGQTQCQISHRSRQP